MNLKKLGDYFMGELSINKIESRIFTIRGLQVMLDRDLAELYGVETRVCPFPISFYV